MHVVDAATTRRHLAAPALIDALRAAFIEGCEVPRRHTHRVAAADADGAGDAGTWLLMPAWRAGLRFGLKTVSICPGNAARGLPALHSTYLLFDAATGVPLAMIDGNTITSHRTAAASALAASYLARADAHRLLVVGSGQVAALLPAAMRAVRPIESVAVWSRRSVAAEALAARLCSEGVEAHAVRDLERAVGAADIVSCATLASVAAAPLIEGAWLAPGTHLDLIGGFTPQMREADAACFALSRVWVDTVEALEKSGDVLEAMAAGAFDATTRLQGTLAALCSGAAPGRASRAERTLFKSVGTALEDLAAAELVWGAIGGEIRGDVGGAVGGVSVS